MTTPFEDLAGLDKLVHEPARLAILTALSAAESVEFLFLQSTTGLTKGNLSAHLAKLEDAELVHINKHFAGKKPVTEVRLTLKGQRAIQQHWHKLDQLRQQANRWQTDE